MPKSTPKPTRKSTSKTAPSTIAGYIEAASPVARDHLRTLHAILKQAAPKATEAIKWRTPVFEMDRILFAFGAFRTHLNFMPTPAVMQAFAKDLAEFNTGKGTVQFPYDRPLPKGLILKMARLRVKELTEKDAKWM